MCFTFKCPVIIFHFVIFNSKVFFYLQQNVAAVIYQRQVYIRVYVLNEGDAHQNGDWRMRIIINNT